MKESIAIRGNDEDAVELDKTSMDNNKMENLEVLEEKMAEKNEESTSEEVKHFDDSCFKTPMLPTRRNSSKKRLNTSKTEINVKSETTPTHLENSTENILDNLEQISLNSLKETEMSLNEEKKENLDEDLYGVFVSIGKHSYLCPRSQQFFAKQYPKLPQKRPSDDKTPLINEIIIDEFSLLLFHSLDDYNILKSEEDQQKERENAEEKRKVYEENVRLGKIKKKGRKSKIDLEKEKRIQKKKLKKEHREANLLKQQELRLQRRQQRRQQRAQLTQEEREERRREKRERREIQAKENKEAREKLREEQAQIKKAKKLESKRLKNLGKSGGTIIGINLAENINFINNSNTKGISLTDSTSKEGQFSSAMASTCLGAATTQNTNSNTFKMNTSELNWKAISSCEKPLASKRLAADLFEQTNSVISSNKSLNSTLQNGFKKSEETPPPTKIKKISENLDVDLDVNSAKTSLKLENGLNNNNTLNQQQERLLTPLKESIPKLNNTTINSSITPFSTSSITNAGSSASSSQQKMELLDMNNPLQKAFMENPEFALTYHQSLASLHAVDPSLASMNPVGSYIQQFPLLTNPQLWQKIEQHQLQKQQQQHQNRTTSSDTTQQQKQEQQRNLNNLFLSSPNFSNQMKNPLNLNSLASTSAGFPPTLSMPSGVPFPQSAALASQLAGAAILGGKGPFLQTSSNKFLSKKSRWSNMHVTIAQEIAKHSDLIKNTNLSESSKTNFIKQQRQQHENQVVLQQQRYQQVMNASGKQQRMDQNCSSSSQNILQSQQNLVKNTKSSTNNNLSQQNFLTNPMQFQQQELLQQHQQQQRVASSSTTPQASSSKLSQQFRTTPSNLMANRNALSTSVAMQNLNQKSAANLQHLTSEQALLTQQFFNPLFFQGNKLSSQLIGSSLDSPSSNSAQHLLAQNYGLTPPTSTTTQTSSATNSLKISPNNALLLQQIGSSSSSQPSTSLASNSQQFAVSQQQLNALSCQLAGINGQFNPMQALQGASLTNGTSAQAAALNSLTPNNSSTLNSQNQQQMAVAQLMLSQFGYIPPLNPSLSQQAQTNNPANFLAGLNTALNPSSFNLQPSALNNSQQTSTSTNSSINSILNPTSNWALNSPANLATFLNNNNNDLNAQTAFLQSLFPTLADSSKLTIQQHPQQSNISSRIQTNNANSLEQLMRQQFLFDQTASMQQQQQLFERVNKTTPTNNNQAQQIQHLMQQQSILNNKNNNTTIDQELLMRQRLFTQYRNMEFNPNIATSSAIPPTINNKMQPQQSNKPNNHLRTATLDSTTLNATPTALHPQQSSQDFFNSLPAGGQALLNSQLMAAVAGAPIAQGNLNPFCPSLMSNMLQKHPQSASTPNNSNSLQITASPSQNSVGGSVVNGTPIKRDV